MKILIVNMSKLRVAIRRKAAQLNLTMTEYFNGNCNVDMNILAKSERRFDEKYADKVTVDLEDYTQYGAIFEDTFNEINRGLGIDTDIFVVEEIESAGEGKMNNRDLLKRIERLESDYHTLLSVLAGKGII